MTEENNNQNNSYETQMKKWTEFALTKVMPLIKNDTQQSSFGYHGLTHTENVVLRGIDYALSENINPLPVILACALHDCARTHDDWDDNHAENAVPIAKDFLKKYDFGLSEKEKESIIEAIKGHTHGENTQDKIAACLWDADRTRLAWEYGFVISKKFSTKRGLEVARFGIEEQKKYTQQQEALLKAIDAPSYILEEKYILDYKNTKDALNYKDVRSVGTDENPIICYHGTPDNIAKFKLSSPHGIINGLPESTYFAPCYFYAVRHTTNRTYQEKKKYPDDKIFYFGNTNIDFDIYEQHLTKKYGYIFYSTYFRPIRSYLEKQKIDKPITLSEQEIKEIITNYYMNKEKSLNQDYINIVCDKFKDKPLKVKKIPTRKEPYIYKVELRGIFPRYTHLSFKEQGIKVPMERVCKYFKIDYPIKDQRKFLHQALQALGTENYYLENKRIYQQATSKYLEEILQLDQKIIVAENRLKEIDAHLNPQQKGLINKIKNQINKRKKSLEKQELMQEKAKLYKELKELNEQKNTLQTKNLEKEKSFNARYADMIKLDNFLSYVDISNGKSKLQEETRAPYVQRMQNILQTYINERSPGELIEREYDPIECERKCLALIDGCQNADGTQNYQVRNLDAIKIVARYTLNLDGTIKKIEKTNSFGHLAPEPQKDASKKPKEKYTPLLRNKDNAL